MPPSFPVADAAPLSRGAAIALLVAFVLIWFSSIEGRRLMHPDEGRYAEIPEK